MPDFDVIVVGGGAIGASALFHLTRRGIRNALLLESKTAFAHGATGAWGALVRVFHLNTLTSERAMETVPYYLDFEARTGYPSGFERTGSLYFLKRSDLPAIQAKVERLNAGPLQLDIVFAPEGRERFPAFQWMEDDFAVYEPHGGCCCPYTVTDSWIQAATEAGAQARHGEAVQDIVVSNGRVQGVTTRQGQTYTCDRLVISAGVWSTALLSQIDEPLPIVPTVIQVNEYFHPGNELHAPFFIDLANNTFGRPSHRGSLMAGYLHDLPSDRNSVHRLSLREAHDAKRHVAARLNWIKTASLRGGIRATEGYTADTNGILRYASRYDNVLVAAAWSCQGFTLAPWVGQQIASRLCA